MYTYGMMKTKIMVTLSSSVSFYILEFEDEIKSKLDLFGNYITSLTNPHLVVSCCEQFHDIRANVFKGHS